MTDPLEAAMAAYEHASNNYWFADGNPSKTISKGGHSMKAAIRALSDNISDEMVEAAEPRARHNPEIKRYVRSNIKAALLAALGEEG